MNNKITLPKLVNLLSLKTGSTKKTCEDYLKSLFSVIGETLASGESVKVKGLGIFKVLDVEARRSVNVSTGEDILIPGHKKISFTPDKDLAVAVNAPFEIFETVELNSEISEKDIMDDDDELVNSQQDIDNEDSEDNSIDVAKEEIEVFATSTDNTEDPTEEEDDKDDDVIEREDVIIEESSESSESPEELVGSSDAEESISEDTLPEESELEETIVKEATSDGSMAEEPKPTIVEIPKPIQIVGVKEDSPKLSPHRSFSRGFLTGFIVSLLILGVMFVVFYFMMINRVEEMLNYDKTAKVESTTAEKDYPQNVKDTVTVISSSKSAVAVGEKTPKTADNTEEVANTTPSDSKNKVVYDEISTTRYLTTMAKEHYGNYQLWPYIYEENKSILGHPDRIRPGTKVVIPPLSKYGVNPKSEADISKAKRLGVEIYSRYK